jgi:TRAP-type uncharacterized transport system fused permease subunit
MACRLGMVVYILPYMFVYNKGLMLMGDLGDIVSACLTALIGVYALACGIQGYMFRPTKIYERIPLFVAALLLISPGAIYDLVGVLLLLGVALRQRPTFFFDLLKRFRRSASEVKGDA